MTTPKIQMMVVKILEVGMAASGVINNLPITPGWNYIVRMYQPKQEIVNGSWSFPKAEPAK
ncbi:MAG: hypothetical protein NT118_04330 [Lentisphaerae bacterium]|nr:hypothetical protein [Lentisphaerota bacterium]